MQFATDPKSAAASSRRCGRSDARREGRGADAGGCEGRLPRRVTDGIEGWTVEKKSAGNMTPTPLIHAGGDDKIRAMRNLRRYIQKAEKVVLNVVRGQLPGEY